MATHLYSLLGYTSFNYVWRLPEIPSLEDSFLCVNNAAASCKVRHENVMGQAHCDWDFTPSHNCQVKLSKVAMLSCFPLAPSSWAPWRPPYLEKDFVSDTHTVPPHLCAPRHIPSVRLPCPPDDAAIPHPPDTATLWDWSFPSIEGPSTLAVAYNRYLAFSVLKKCHDALKLSRMPSWASLNSLHSRGCFTCFSL